MSPNLELITLNSDTEQKRQDIENMNFMLLEYLDQMKKRSVSSGGQDNVSALTLKLDVWSWKLLYHGLSGHFCPLAEFRTHSMLQTRRVRKC